MKGNDTLKETKKRFCHTFFCVSDTIVFFLRQKDVICKKRMTLFILE